MEILAATQALDMLAPLKPADGVLAAFELVRQKVPFAKEDRIFAQDVKAIRDLILSDEIVKAVEKVIGPLEL